MEQAWWEAEEGKGLGGPGTGGVRFGLRGGMAGLYS